MATFKSGPDEIAGRVRRSRRRKQVRRALALAVVTATPAIISPKPTHAATSLYWSGTGTWADPGAVGGWSTTSSSPSYTGNWTDGDAAVFQGTAGTVTVSGNITNVNSINFTTDGYTLAGNGNTTPVNGNTTSGTAFITLTGTGGNITTGSGNDTISAYLGGSVGMTKLGSGNLTISGAVGSLTIAAGGSDSAIATEAAPYYYTGGTVISQGTLQLSSETAYTNDGAGNIGGIIGNLTIDSGATVVVNVILGLGVTGSGGFNNSITVGNVIINGGTLTTGTANTAQVNGINASNGGRICQETNFYLTGGTINGTGWLCFKGSGSPVLQTFASSTESVISAPIQIRGNYTLPITVASGTVSNGVDLLISGNISNATTAGTSTGGTDGATYPDGLTKLGPGVLQLSGNNTYAGNTTISAGTLLLGSVNAVQESTVYMSGGNLTFSSNIGNFTLGGLSSSGNITLLDTASQPVTISVGNNGSTNTYSGILSGNGALTLIGGAQTLSGNSIFTGNITISGGTLNAALNENSSTAASGALGNAAVSGRSITVNNGGTLAFTQGNVLSGGATAPSVTLVVNSGGTITTAIDNNNLGPLTLNGGTITTTGNGGSTSYWDFGLTSTVTVTGNTTSTMSGNTSVGGGYNLGLPSSPSVTFNVDPNGNGASLLVSGILGNAIGSSSTAASLIKTGVGNMTLTASNVYSGGTTISAGPLWADNSSGSATGTGGITVAAGTGNYTGGMLGGNGTASGTVTLSGNNTVKHGGVIIAGANSTSYGVLTTGNQSWYGGAAYQWKISTVGTGQTSGNVTTLSQSPGTSTNDALTISPLLTSGTLLTLNTSSGATGNAAFTIAPLGNITVTTGKTYNWEIAQIGGASSTGNISVITSGGTTYYNATSVGALVVASNAWSNVSAFALDTSGLTINDNSQFLSSSDFSLYFETISGNNDLVLSYNAVPEPTTGLLILAGGLPMLWTHRRRRKAELGRICRPMEEEETA